VGKGTFGSRRKGVNQFGGGLPSVLKEVASASEHHPADAPDRILESPRVERRTAHA
jgi:hypothetical protein